METSGHSNRDASSRRGSWGERARAWRASLPVLVPCFFGFSLMRAYNDLVARRFSEAPFAEAWTGEDLYSLVLMAVFLAGALAARRVAPLYCRPKVVAAATVLAVAGAVLVGAAPLAGQGLWACFFSAMLASGVSGALFILLWAEFHSCLDPLGIVVYVSGSFLLGTAGAWVLQELTGVHEAIALAVMPLASVACLRASFARIAPMDLPRTSWGRYDFPWRLILVLGVYEFAYGVREGTPSFQWDAYPLSVILVTAAVFLLAFAGFKRVDFVLVYRSPIPLMICGLAAVPITAALGTLVSDVLVSAGYALMFLVLTCLLCDLSHRYGVSVLVLCGVQELTAVFRLAGHQVSQLAASGAVPALEDGAALSAVLTVLVILASTVLLLGRSSSAPWGAAFFGVGAMARESAGHEELVRRCAQLASAHGLSAREREVLDLVAQGRSPSQIERELVIANGTLKSHMRRIYQKLGIHSKKELLAMVGADGKAPASEAKR